MNAMQLQLYSLLSAMNLDGHITLRTVCYCFVEKTDNPYLMTFTFERQNVLYDVTIDWHDKFRVTETVAMKSKTLHGINTREEFEDLLTTFL